MKLEKDLIEILAEFEHDRWSVWQKYVHYICIKNNDGSYIIPKEYVNRWNNEIETEYKSLPNSIQESDRKQVKKMLKVLEDNGYKIVKGEK